LQKVVFEKLDVSRSMRGQGVEAPASVVWQRRIDSNQEDRRRRRDEREGTEKRVVESALLFVA
jgi:hypothetical protein